MKKHLAALFVLALTACHPHQPQNIADYKQSLVQYHDSGYYMRDFAVVDRKAQRYLDTHLAGVKQPAIVLDIDETSLSNWPEMLANNFDKPADSGPCTLPKGPCAHHAWQAMARGEALLPTLSLYQDAKSRNVAVFFITGRDEALRAATERNLKAAGYTDWVKLVMRPHGSTTPSAADYKAPERAKIEGAGYTIIESVGDQQSDLSGGHAQETFLVPNPWYRIP